MSGITELYRKYRPNTLEEVRGQDSIISTLKKKIEKGELPHAIMLSGASGIGKTTIARILARELGCFIDPRTKELSTLTFKEINCADARGIETIRQISETIKFKPISGECSVWLLDEFHQVTTTGQDALLKTLEEPPSHAYIFLCTTDPGKVKPTIKTRCLPIALQPLKQKTMEELLRSIIKKEKRNISEEVIMQITDISEGSARKGLVLLEQIIDLEESQQLELLSKEEASHQAFEVAQALMKKKGAVPWSEMAKILSTVTEPQETIRQIILKYCTSVMLKGGPNSARAYYISTCFSSMFQDSGKNGLVSACYEIICMGK